MTDPTFAPDEYFYVAAADPELDDLWARIHVLRDRLEALRAGWGRPGDNEQALELEIEAASDRCQEITSAQFISKFGFAPPGPDAAEA
jgi:hypothetical protein